MNDFEKYLLTSGVEIQKEIKSVLSTWSSVVEEKTPALSRINNLFAESFTGGKYIRGTLVKMGFEITGSKKNKEIIKIAAAFEILHTSLLIHDDIIDKSEMRRAKPSLHTVFKNSHYGISQAICLGDVGFFLANKLIADSDISPKIKNMILSEFSQIVLETILGQMLDIKTSFEKIKKEKDALTIQRLKTAYYTIAGPLSIGALLGNANAKQLKAIKIFGESIGTAYQIQDDILGVFGNEKIIGKSTMSDIQENKNTLLISYALKKATVKQKQFLKKYYGAKNINQRQLEEIKKIFIDTGSLSYSQMKVKKYISEAKSIIPSLTAKKSFEKLINHFTEFIIHRQK